MKTCATFPACCDVFTFFQRKREQSSVLSSDENPIASHYFSFKEIYQQTFKVGFK